MIGAGAVALLGAAAGTSALLGGQGQSGPEPGAPLELPEPILGGPSRSGSPAGNSSGGRVLYDPVDQPTISASPAPITAKQEPTQAPATSQAPTSEPSASETTEPSDSASREASAEPSAGDQSSSKPEAAEESTAAPQAQYTPVDSAAVYQAAPPTPTLEGKSPLAPNLTLKSTPAWHLARRASYSATAILAAEIEKMGPEAWIDWQLKPENIDDSQVENLISTYFPWSKESTHNIAGQTEDTFLVSSEITHALLLRRRFSNRHLAEVVYDVLADHVHVPVDAKASEYGGEYDAILRKHGLGRYSDLLHALITHPALIIELDNQVSTKKNPNENLGRELLELYTVGVGKYSEQDVRQSALLLTGHGVDWDAHVYKYTPDDHHTGALKIMGFQDANSDAAAGPDLLRRYIDFLTKQESTAKRLAKRFAVRFISDDPKQATIDAIAKAYLDNDTSIAAMVRATLTHPDFAASLGQKWRRPGELISAIARSAQPTKFTPRGVHGSDDPWDLGVYGWLIQVAGDLPRNWPVVDGYPDVASYWNSTSIALPMINAAQFTALGDREESERTSWPRVLQFAVGSDAIEVARRITWHLTGYQWPNDLVLKIADLLRGLSEAESATALKAKDLEDWAAHAVRVIYASPFASLR